MTLTGQVGIISNGTAFWPKVIEWATRSRAHHIVVAVSDTHCLSAEPGGARIRPISDFPTAVWSRFPLALDQRVHIAYWCHTKRFVPYNYRVFAVNGLHLVLHVPVPAWLYRWAATPNRLVCSQLADIALTAAGVSVIDDGRPFGIVFPGDWEQEFRRRGWI